MINKLSNFGTFEKVKKILSGRPPWALDCQCIPSAGVTCMKNPQWRRQPGKKLMSCITKRRFLNILNDSKLQILLCHTFLDKKHVKFLDKREECALFLPKYH